MILRTISRNLLRSNRYVSTKLIDYAVCIDIECTCDSPVQIYPMEIIEIACLKLDLRAGKPSHDKCIVPDERQNLGSISSLERCATFHSFVKPVINPHLTFFCQELTGVMQSTVDKSKPLEEVIDDLFLWLKEQDLIDTDYGPKEEFAFASCGNFDLSLLSPLVRRCKFTGDHELPIYFREWINVKKTFVNHKKEWPKGLYHMLEILGGEPSGRLHSAEDDCKNLARVVKGLQAQGCRFHITNKVS